MAKVEHEAEKAAATNVHMDRMVKRFNLSGAFRRRWERLRPAVSQALLGIDMEEEDELGWSEAGVYVFCKLG